MHVFTAITIFCFKARSAHQGAKLENTCMFSVQSLPAYSPIYSNLMNREVGRIRIHESQTPFVFVFMRERQLTIQGLLIVFMIDKPCHTLHACHACNSAWGTRAQCMQAHSVH